MMKHAFAAWALTLLGALTGGAFVLPANAATIQVRPGQDLQAAVAAAAPGDTLEVQRGFYRTNLHIDKALTLRGVDRPTLSGGQQGDTIRITAPRRGD